MATNSDILKAGFKTLDGIIENAMLDILHEYAVLSLKDVQNQKEFYGFTGQTQTSYIAGVFINGKLLFTVDSAYSKRKPVFRKIRKNEAKYLEEPYEGPPRGVTGKVDVNGLSGKDTSIAFLTSLKDVPKKGYAVVVATGTEYSEYIESSRGLNVMTNTAAFSDVIFGSVIKATV